MVIKDCAIIIRKGGLQIGFKWEIIMCLVPRSQKQNWFNPSPLDLLIIFTTPSPHTKYNVTVKVEMLENRLRYLLSDKPACAGRFLREEYTSQSPMITATYKAMKEGDESYLG